MITTAQEYNSHLHIVNNPNPPIFAQLPSAETTYYIDIKERSVIAPEFIGVAEDHKSETIYFIVDRFVDYMDLTETCCIINYITANGKTGVYSVPFYDIFTLKEQHQILIPWIIDKYVTQIKGKIKFSIQFFQIDENNQYRYNLNIKPAETQVLNGFIATDKQTGNAEEDLEKSIPRYEELLGKITALENRADDNFGVYWTILPNN